MKLSLILTIAVLLIFTSCGKKEAGATNFAKDLKDPQKQGKALIELEKLGPKAKSAIPQLMSLLEEDDKKAAKDALRIIIKVGEEKDIIAAAKIGVKSKNKTVTTLSINSLKKLKNKTPEVLEIIVGAIESTEMFTREAGILAAGELKIKTAVPLLIKVLVNTSESQNIILNKQAARSLGQIGDERAITPLIKGLFIRKQVKKVNGQERGKTAFVFARNALVSFGKAGLKIVLETLDGKNEDFNAFKKANPNIKSSDINYNLIVMINEMGDESVFPVLEKYMTNKDLGIRLQAEAGMGSIGIKKSVPVLIKRYALLKKAIQKGSQDEAVESLKELQNINRMLAMIGGAKAEKHLVAEMTGKPLKIEGEEFGELNRDSRSSFSNFASAKYYKVYQGIWAKQKSVEEKMGALLHLKIMEVADKCKEDVKCYGDFFDKKKNVKLKGKALKALGKELGGLGLAKALPVFRKQKAAYMLSNFNTPEAKKILLEKALFDKDPGVRAAGAYSIGRIGTKADIPALEEVVKKANKKSYLKKARSLYSKLLAKLKNK